MQESGRVRHHAIESVAETIRFNPTRAIFAVSFKLVAQRGELAFESSRV